MRELAPIQPVQLVEASHFAGASCRGPLTVLCHHRLRGVADSLSDRQPSRLPAAGSVPLVPLLKSSGRCRPPRQATSPDASEGTGGATSPHLVCVCARVRAHLGTHIYADVRPCCLKSIPSPDSPGNLIYRGSPPAGGWVRAGCPSSELPRRSRSSPSGPPIPAARSASCPFS